MTSLAQILFHVIKIRSESIVFLFTLILLVQYTIYKKFYIKKIQQGFVVITGKFYGNVM